MRESETQFYNPLYLSRFEISDLFGYRQINFDLTAQKGVESKSINILYGVNGLGKSTILRFIFNFLSGDRGKGQKTWISKTPFSQANLYFNDGRLFRITKQKNGDLIIDYEDRDLSDSFHVVTEESAVKTDTVGSEIERLLTLLDALPIEIFYMTDKREFLTTSKSLGEHLNKKSPHLVFDIIESIGAPRRSARSASQDSAPAISEMSSTIATIFRQDIAESGISGQQNANSIHLDVVRALAKGEVGKTETRSELTSLLNTVRAELLDAEKFGAVPRIDFSGYQESINIVPKESLQQLAFVLRPFFEGMLARSRAASVHLKRMKVFVDELNHFYEDKIFSFSIRNGFSIVSKHGGKQIDFDWLSSGEKQLFTILSSVFLTQNATGLVLIDEPELSLNILWQREFVDALQRISQRSPLQYVLASHSLEILNSRYANIINLK